MALREIQVPVPFSGGIDTKTDPKRVPPVKLLDLQNCVFTRGGSIVKRWGYASLGLAVDGSATAVSGLVRLATRDSELLGLTNSHCYSHDPEANLWVDAGDVFSVAGSDSSAVRTGTMQTMPDHASNGGVTAFAWEDNRGGVWWSAVATTTGRDYRAPEQLDGSGTRPRCIPCGDGILVLWASGTSIKCALVNPSTPSRSPTITTLADDLNASNPTYDAEATGMTGNPGVIAWALNGTADFRVSFVHPSGVLGSPSNGYPSGVREVGAGLTGPISVCSNLTTDGAGGTKVATIGVAFRPSSNIGVRTYSAGIPGTSMSAAVVSTTITMSGTVNRLSSMLTHAGTLRATWEIAGPGPTSQRRVQTAVVGGSVSSLLSVGLASRVFEFNGEAFVFAVHDTTYFNTYFVVRLTDLMIVGRMLPGSAAGAPTRPHLSSVQSQLSSDTSGDKTSTQFQVCLPVKDRLLSENNDKFTETGLRLLALDFDADLSHRTAQLGRGLYMAGACPMHYDGAVWTEQGFHVGPELMSAVSDSMGGSMTTSGVYEYVVWYEWTDDEGEVHRGATSIPLKVTLGGSDTEATVTFPMLRLTAKKNVRVCIGRSKNGDASALYRVTSSDPTTAGSANGYIVNDPTVDSGTFVDQMSEDTLTTQEPVYTNGGILSNDPPPLGNLIAVGKSRLFVTDPGDPNVIRYSQEIDQGYGAEFAPELQIRCDPYGGAITALATMDEQLIIFKEHAIYITGGDGPLPNGDSSQSGFSTPQLVTSDAGCTDPQSIALTPNGLIFKSAKGIYLIDRSRTLSYIGAPAEVYNGQTVRRATLLQDKTQVLFLTDSGRTLLYDYYFDQWSTFTNHEGFDAAIVDGLYHYVRTDGRVFREAPGVYSDDGRNIVMRLETAWIKMQPYLQGFARFWWAYIIGELKSPHQFKVQYQTDYTNHWSEPSFADASGSASASGWVGETGLSWPGVDDDTIVGTSYGDGNYGDGPYGGTPPGAYQWRVHLDEIGQAIRFRFEDFETAGTAGPCFELSELLLTGGIIGSVPKPLSATRSV